MNLPLPIRCAARVTLKPFGNPPALHVGNGQTNKLVVLKFRNTFLEKGWFGKMTTTPTAADLPGTTSSAGTGGAHHDSSDGSGSHLGIDLATLHPDARTALHRHGNGFGNNGNPLEHLPELTDPQIQRILGECEALEDLLPPDFWQLPRVVQALTLLDWLQGANGRRAIEALVATGVPRNQAKLIVRGRLPTQGDPAGLTGEPYLTVWHRCLRRPTAIDYGGVGFDGNTADGSFIQFPVIDRGVRRLTLLRALLGWSANNGGGPGVMRWISQGLIDGVRLAATRGIISDSKVIQVILRIGREPPNGLASPGHITWSIDGLHARTRMLMTLGIPLAFFIFPGGFGTLEEEGATLTDDQLFAMIVTALQFQAPIYFVDFPASATGDRWVKPILELRKLMARFKCVKPEHFGRHNILDITDPTSIDGAIRSMDELFTRIYGYSALAKFEQAHGKSVFEVADELLKAHES